MDNDVDIISFIIDNPDFYHMIANDLEPKDFEDKSCSVLLSVIDRCWKSSKTVPTRKLLKQLAGKLLKSSDDYSLIEDIYKIINYRLDPRDIPIIRDNLKLYVQKKIYDKLYSEEYLQAHINGEHGKIDSIVEEARKLEYVDTNYQSFGELYEKLFIEEKVEHLTSGFVDLDAHLNNGGPLKGELLTFLAPTGKGKSMFMTNSGVMLVRRGFNVLHVSMEMKNTENALRYLGVFTEQDLSKRYSQKEKFKELILRDLNNNKNGLLMLAEYAADSISIDTISALIRNLEHTKGWRPDAVIVDYLELMISRVAAYNSSGNDYSKQKQIATELFGFANRENVLVITANQTNRDGYKGTNDEVKIGLGQQAESFGKSMPMTYIVSINQSKQQYESEPATAELYIAKNRNGPANKTVNVKINYKSFKILPHRIDY